MDINLEELVQAAQEQAAIKADTWYPVKKGDNIAGKIVGVTTGSSQFGSHIITTLDVTGKPVMDGKTLKPGFYHVWWIGAIPESKQREVEPDDGDVTAWHYQDDVKPKNPAFDAYKQTNIIVIDGRTGKAKRPVTAQRHLPSDVNPSTGEVQPGQSPLKQFEDLPPFPDEE